jgi:hypothetical protein
MPDDVVRKTNNFVARSLGHFGKSLGFGLIFECIAWEVNAYGKEVSLEEDNG